MKNKKFPIVNCTIKYMGKNYGFFNHDKNDNILNSVKEAFPYVLDNNGKLKRGFSITTNP